MKYLVGYSADQGGREALALGILLARSCGGSLAVCMIVPETWGHPSPARVDAEYAAFLEQHASTTLEAARAAVPGDIAAEFVSRAAPSAHDGLLAAAAELGADWLVLGSARSAPSGRFGLGGVTSDVLHAAPLPVALAPKDHAPDPEARVKRLTCMVSGASTSRALALASAGIAGRFGVPLRLATLVVRDKQMYPTGAGYDAENMVANELRRQAGAAQAAVMADWPSPVPVSGEIGDGDSWKSALESLDWADAELLVIGSSSLGPLLRVFLGSNSGRIAHSAPVPCLVLPRPEA